MAANNIQLNHNPHTRALSLPSIDEIIVGDLMASAGTGTDVKASNQQQDRRLCHHRASTDLPGGRRRTNNSRVFVDTANVDGTVNNSMKGPLSLNASAASTITASSIHSTQSSLTSTTMALKTRGGKHSFFFGLFDCCNDAATTKENSSTSKQQPAHPCNKLFEWSFLSKLLRNNSHDAFTSITSKETITNSNASIVSEASAFSAPTSPVMTHRLRVGSNSSNIDHLSSSQHANNYLGLYSSTHNATGSSSMHSNNKSQHPLRKYALKSIRLDRTEGSSFGGSAISSTDEAELRNEISILRALDHPHIVHIIEAYEYKRMIYLVLDLCEGGDLYVLDPYSEVEAKSILRQLFQAVGYMHRRGIYGKAKSKWNSKKETIMTDFVGTIYTMAPEVIKGNYTYKCDMWSLGVMAYMLFSSQIPFIGKDMSEIAKKIMRGSYSFSGKQWSKVSKRAKDFVQILLVRDASSRPTADQALRHPWIKGGSPSASPKRLQRRHSGGECSAFSGTLSRSINSPKNFFLDSQICASIENYSMYSWLHRLALMVIGYRYTGSETAHLRHIFTSFDGDNSGTVESDELRRAFALHDKYSDDEIDQIFSAVDMNGAGKISWTEFLAATIETMGKVGEDEFSECFEQLDCDNSGYIDASVRNVLSFHSVCSYSSFSPRPPCVCTQNLREILGKDLPLNIIDQIIDEADITRDHKIWKEEFMALAEESVGIGNDDDVPRRKSLHFVLKRSKSADDFEDTMKHDFGKDAIADVELTWSASDETIGNGEDQFNVEKAKSIRKASRFV
eukprot:scaffold2409_cov230-Alexandrium_tamarense.AAC.10